MKTLLVLAWLFVNKAFSMSDANDTTSVPVSTTTSGAKSSSNPTTHGAQSSSSPTGTGTTMQDQGNGTSTEGSGSASVQIWMPLLFIVLLISKFSVLVAC